MESKIQSARELKVASFRGRLSITMKRVVSEGKLGMGTNILDLPHIAEVSKTPEIPENAPLPEIKTREKKKKKKIKYSQRI